MFTPHLHQWNTAYFCLRDKRFLDEFDTLAFGLDQVIHNDVDDTVKGRTCRARFVQLFPYLFVAFDDRAICFWRLEYDILEIERLQFAED